VEVGNLRETVHLKTDQACRLQFVIVAVATRRDAKRTRKVCCDKFVFPASKDILVLLLAVFVVVFIFPDFYYVRLDF